MNKKILFSVLFSLNVIILFAQKAQVTFFIKDFENQKELNEVEVFIADSLIGKTNAEGFLTVDNIKSGVAKVTIQKNGFDKFQIENDLQNGGFYEYVLNKSVAVSEILPATRLDSLAPQQPVVILPPVEKKEQNTSVFKAKAKYASEAQALTEQRKASEIKEIRSGEELSRKGASNVAKGVEKGAGITNVQGRGIFVRGLEDRYNNLLINGLAVPSNNPFNKIIDLSLIPNDVVGNLEIYKTYNSNIYADFAGATINIETITPQKPVTRINFGASYITDNNLSKFLIASRQNSTAGFFGLRGNERKIPSIFGSVPKAAETSGQMAVDVFKSGFGADQIYSTNNSNYGIFHAGKFSRKLSYLVTSNFDNKYQIREGVERTFNLGGQGNYINNFQTSEYSYLTNFSTLAAINYKLNRGLIGLNALYLKSSEVQIKDQLGYTQANTNFSNQFIRTNQYQESNYLNIQLLGDYFLTEDKNHQIKGGLTYNTNSLKQPDRNFLDVVKISDTQVQYRYSGNSNLQRQSLDVKGKYFISQMTEYNWLFGKKNEFDKISLGVNSYISKYESSFRTIRTIVTDENNSVIEQTVDLNNIDDEINQDLLSGVIKFKEQTSSNQYFSSVDDFVVAPYFNLFYQLTEKLQANLGVRAEQFNRKITFNLVEELDRNSLIFLPALNFKYALNNKSNLRLATSQTTTRPTIMEILPLAYINPDGTELVGNKNLDFSNNFQADLKYEFFPSNNELIVVSVFGKKIENPIEKGVQASGSSGQTITFFNSKQATVLGTELEFIFALKRINPLLKNFKIGANASYLYTNVTIDKVTNPLESFDERALQGASPWLANADLRYDFKFNKEWQNTISTVFNMYGRRIFAVGSAGFDHIYENPMPTLDLVWSSTLSDHWKLNFNASNILNPTYRLEHGQNYDKSKVSQIENSLVTKEFKRGINFGLTATYTF